MKNFVTWSATDKGNAFFATDPASPPSLELVSLPNYGPSASPTPNYNYIGDKSNPKIILVGILSIIVLVIIFEIVYISVKSFLVVRENRRAFRRSDTNDDEEEEEGDLEGATVGLERTVIESFPVFSNGLVKGLKSHEAKGSECAVCLSDFGENEMVRLLPKCSHAFHPECIDTWLCSHTTCPLCRVSLVLGEDSGVPTVTAEQRTPPEHISIVVHNGNDEAQVGV